MSETPRQDDGRIPENNVTHPDGSPIPDVWEESQTSKGTRSQSLSPDHISMHQAAITGDWKAAKKLLQGRPSLVRDEITARGDRALHVAAAVKQMNFVKELIETLNPEDLLLENKSGYTAFVFAAVTGIVEIVKLMAEKNQSVVNTPYPHDKVTPIYVAALHVNTDMVMYLSEFRSQIFPTEKLFDLLQVTIYKNMYDVALKLLEDYGPILTSMQVSCALHLLAAHDISDISGKHEAFLKSLVRMFAAVPFLSWFKRIRERQLMRKDAKLLVEKLLAKIQTPEQAIELDNLLILHEAAKAARSDANIYYNEKIKDEDGKDILHLAGEIAPPSRLKIVVGAALQMQRECLWFKEVEKTVRPLSLKMGNSDLEKPRELFSLSHEKLLVKGEKWMRDTANSCMITATLIATVVFAAVITVPGGNNGDTGNPILLKKSLFRVFVVSDVAAMFFSTFSIIMFLSILTSHFEEDDFLVSLPRKLIFGLTSLFASIVSTMFAFISTCFLVFTDQIAWLSISFSVLASLSLTILFGYMHFQIGVQTSDIQINIFVQLPFPLAEA